MATINYYAIIADETEDIVIYYTESALKSVLYRARKQNKEIGKHKSSRLVLLDEVTFKIYRLNDINKKLNEIKEKWNRKLIIEKDIIINPILSKADDKFIKNRNEYKKKIYQKERIICECGGTYTNAKSVKTKHMKTKKHINFN